MDMDFHPGIPGANKDSIRNPVSNSEDPLLASVQGLVFTGGICGGFGGPGIPRYLAVKG